MDLPRTTIKVIKINSISLVLRCAQNALNRVRVRIIIYVFVPDWTVFSHSMAVKCFLRRTSTIAYKNHVHDRRNSNLEPKSITFNRFMCKIATKNTVRVEMETLLLSVSIQLKSMNFWQQKSGIKFPGHISLDWDFRFQCRMPIWANSEVVCVNNRKTR